MVLQAPELLALDSINYMKKSSISVTSSEDSIISIDSTDSVGKSSHKRVRCMHWLGLKLDYIQEIFIDVTVNFSLLILQDYSCGRS